MAFYFDRGISYFGNHITAELEAATKDTKSEKMAAAKQQMVLNRWLTDETGSPVRRFRDPARR